MRYCISDIHGEYELFMGLLGKINFSDDDEMYICGDIIDKGRSPLKLAKYIFSKPNIHTIVGNHEYDFLKLYHSLIEGANTDYDTVLEKLRGYFTDGDLLDYELLDAFDSLPYFIDGDDFICVHAGVEIDGDGRVIHPSKTDVRELVYNRRFKEPTLIPVTSKCIIFGHTTTGNISGENKILAYKRADVDKAASLRDFCKIHIDTGAWSHGVIGCLCMDTCKVCYVKKQDLVSDI